MHKSPLIAELRAYWTAEAATPQLSVWRQFVEMVLLYLLRRIGPRYYLQARWGRRSIRFRDKWTHVNRPEYLAVINRLNPSAYHKASQHKLIEKSLLTLQNLPTPRFIGYVHPHRGRSADGLPLRSAQQVESLLSHHDGEIVCFKLVEGWGGMGFMSFLVRRRNEVVELLRDDGEPPLCVAHWWETFGRTPGGFVVEAYLAQHADLAALNKTSVNTVRVWVIILSDGSAKILGAYLRVGRAGSQVDNISSGGIVCQVSVDSGKVTEAFDPRRPGDTLAFHPDSGAMLTGFVVPQWDEAKALAIEALLAFPNVRLAGLDIAFGTTRPTIIELNVMADYIGCAWMDLPLKQVSASEVGHRSRSGR